MGSVVNAMSRPLYPPGKRADTRCVGGGVGPGADLDRCGKSRPHRDKIPDPPARGESLHRLRYPGPML